MVLLPAPAVSACIAWTMALQGNGQLTALAKHILHLRRRIRRPLQMRTMGRRRCEKALLIFTHDRSDISMLGMTTNILSTLLLLQVNPDHTIQTNRWLIPCDNTIEVTIQCLLMRVMGLQRTMMSMDNTVIMAQTVAPQT